MSEYEIDAEGAIAAVTSTSEVDMFDAGVSNRVKKATMAQLVTYLQNNGLGNPALPRNLLDCTDFTINPWQLGTSFNGNGPTPVLTADRWNANSGTSLVWTAGQASNTAAAGFTASYQWGRSVGDTHTVGLSIGQVIETPDSIRAQGQTVYLSTWIMNDANWVAGASGGTLTAYILAGTGTNESSGKMFSGAWSGMTTVASAVITPTTTLTRITACSGAVPASATELGVAFAYTASAGTTAGTHESLQFVGPQLEIGGVTPYEHLEIAETVNIATRYLQVINEPTAGIAIGPASYSAASLAIVHVPLPSPMRKAPTLTFTAGGFAIYDQAQTAHGVTGALLLGATTGALTLAVTAAATLSSGNSAGPAFLQGRTTNSGVIILNADF
jgi:hypothetical protein